VKCPFCGAEDTAVADTRLNDEAMSSVAAESAMLATSVSLLTSGLKSSCRRWSRKTDCVPNSVVPSCAPAWSWRYANGPVSIESVDAAVADIEEMLLSAGEREVSTQQLGELVMRELKKLDKVAYIRFASVYRNFEDVDAFSRAIREVSPTPKKK
jgi:transcriptional repressor NrdR